MLLNQGLEANKVKEVSGRQTRGKVKMSIEIEQEVDGRWIADIPELPGVMTYGATKQEAVAHVEALALRVLADRAGGR